jgi:DNA-binding NtrC family response regulator
MYDLTFLLLQAESAESDTTSFTVTLVDDDPFFKETMRDYLTSMNIKKIEMYDSGEKFLEVFKEGDNRLVVLDYDFGPISKFDGMGVLEEIRKRDKKIPVIMLSAQDNMAIALETLRRGALDYFIKGNQSTYTSVLASILKINELQRLKKSQREYMITGIVGGAIFAIMVWFAYAKYF